METVDLRDAFPIHPGLQRNLRLAVRIGTEVRHFQCQDLPLGLALSPKVLAESLAP